MAYNDKIRDMSKGQMLAELSHSRKHVAELEREVEQLRADKARIDTLEAMQNDASIEIAANSSGGVYIGWMQEYWDGGDLRGAIDAARQENEGE